MTPPLKSVPKVKNPGTAAALIAVASSQIGYTEGAGNNTAYGAWYKLNHNAWCAMFVSWAAKAAGCDKVIPRHAYTPAGAQWFKDRGLWGEKPRVGAIVYYDTAGLGRISHVGIVDQVFADGSWTSIEGNTNAAGSREGRVVRRQKRRTTGTSRGGFGYPRYAKAPSGGSQSPAETPKPAPQWTDSGKVARLQKGVRLGESHPQTKVLKDCLEFLGFGKFAKPRTGDYGPLVASAVVAFHNKYPQYKSKGVRQDPHIGPAGFDFLQRKAGRRS